MSLTEQELSLLAVFYIILIGAGLMPVLEAIAQNRVARKIATMAFFDTIVSYLRNLVPAIVLGVIGLALIPSAAVAQAPLAPSDSAVVDSFLKATKAGKKQIPTWLLDLGARIYAAYRVHQISKKADKAASLALAALDEISRLRDGIEAGQIASERELHLARLRIEAQATRIEDLAHRLIIVEAKTDRLMGSVFRRACPVLYAWDTKVGRCTNRQ